MSDTAWETVIGLEVHVQLATESKIFSGSATAFGHDAQVDTQEYQHRGDKDDPRHFGHRRRDRQTLGI